MFEAILDRGSSDRGLSSKLWRKLSAEPFEDPRRGVFHFDDFHFLRSDDYTLTQATTGTAALDATVRNGVVLLDSASTTAAQGANLQFAGPIIEPAAGRKIAFETLVKAADIATGPEFFAGLSIVDTSIIAASALSATDFIGFYSLTDDNILKFATEDGSTSTIADGSPHTLVDDTYVKLGFFVDGLSYTEVYVDGVLWSHGTSTPFDIPSSAVLVPSFVCQSGGTTDPITHIDWYAVGCTG